MAWIMYLAAAVAVLFMMGLVGACRFILSCC